jgi:hypothetical protein
MAGQADFKSQKCRLQEEIEDGTTQSFFIPSSTMNLILLNMFGVLQNAIHPITVDIVFKHYGKPFLQHLIQSHQS